VRRLAKQDGVTVFLTTQYLEEADSLADRVGIIDNGVIVTEGTPAALKEEIGEPGVEVVTVDSARTEDAARVLQRFGGGECPHYVDESIAVRLKGGSGSLAELVRALDAEGIEVAHLQLHPPTLDDVFLAKTGRTLEGAGEDDEDDPDAGAPTRAAESAAA
jgi:ABC-2 type transport system ATP-binding protein